MIRKWILGAFLLTLATPASAGSCDALLAAHDKEAHTPHRYDNKVLRGDRLELELTEIAVNGKTYAKTTSTVRPEGWRAGMLRPQAWRDRTWDPDKDAAVYRKASARNAPDCHADGTDAIDGDPADIIISVNANGFTTRSWISRATGLPMKEESLPYGDQTTLSTYSYNDVTPPDTK